jgi:hypothetical protein
MGRRDYSEEEPEAREKARQDVSTEGRQLLSPALVQGQQGCEGARVAGSATLRQFSRRRTRCDGTRDS